MAIPESGYLVLEEGRYGPIFPRTPACYGFSVIGKVKEGREQAIRDYGKEIEAAVAADPKVLRRCSCITCGGCCSMSAGARIFSIKASLTPISISTSKMQSRFSTAAVLPRCSPIWKGFPRTGGPTFRRSMTSSGTHHFPSFLEYGEYPFVTADEVKKALRLKAAFSDMLDQMQ